MIHTVIETKTYKGKGRPPYTNNLGSILSPAQSQVTSQAHKPICADTLEKHLVPLGRDLLSRDESADLSGIYRCIKDTTVARDDSHDEQ